MKGALQIGQPIEIGFSAIRRRSSRTFGVSARSDDLRRYSHARKRKARTIIESSPHRSSSAARTRTSEVPRTPTTARPRPRATRRSRWRRRQPRAMRRKGFGRCIGHGGKRARRLFESSVELRRQCAPHIKVLAVRGRCKPSSVTSMSEHVYASLSFEKAKCGVAAVAQQPADFVCFVIVIDAKMSLGLAPFAECTASALFLFQLRVILLSQSVPCADSSPSVSASPVPFRCSFLGVFWM